MAGTDEKETGKGLRAEAKRGREIGFNMSGICDDLYDNMEIPASLCRAWIQNVKPKQIKTGMPVRLLLSVYNVGDEPLIVFTGKDNLVCLWYKGEIIFRFVSSSGYQIFVGNDGAIDLLVYLTHYKIGYYPILPVTSSEPSQTTTDMSLCQTFRTTFGTKHGHADVWNSGNVIINLIAKNDPKDETDQGNDVTDCKIGSIGSLRIAIVKCGSKLYQIVLGWAEDFDNSGK